MPGSGQCASRVRRNSYVPGRPVTTGRKLLGGKAGGVVVWIFSGRVSLVGHRGIGLRPGGGGTGLFFVGTGKGWVFEGGQGFHPEKLMARNYKIISGIGKL